jgi:hypothetical protein
MRRAVANVTAVVANVEDLPSAPEAALKVEIAGYSLMLDPAATAPYALVGVMVDAVKLASVHLMRPGDRLDVPSGFKKLYMFNAMGWVTAGALAANMPAGRLELLVAESLTDDFPRYRSDHPLANAIASQVNQGEVNALAAPSYQHQANLGWGAQLTPLVPLTGVRKLRVTVFPAQNAAGSITFEDPYPPVGFAAQLRPWVLSLVKSDVDKTLVATGPFNGWRGPLWAPADPQVLVWSPHSAGDVNASATDCVFEFDVPSGLLLGFQLVALAGAPNLFASMEAY